MFVPSGWCHQVHNETTEANRVVISINENWGNAFNAERTFQFLCREWEACKNQLVDLMPLMPRHLWLEQCEQLMKANDGGMNWADFEKYLDVILELSLNESNEIQEFSINQVSSIRHRLNSIERYFANATTDSNVDAFSSTAERHKSTSRMLV